MEVALCLRNSSLKLSKFLLTKIFCISWVRTLLTISGRLLWSDTRRGKAGEKEEKKKKSHFNNCRKQCNHKLFPSPSFKICAQKHKSQIKMSTQTLLKHLQRKHSWRVLCHVNFLLQVHHTNCFSQNLSPVSVTYFLKSFPGFLKHSLFSEI